MIDNENPVHDLRTQLVMAKGPAWEPGTDLLAVQETAADQVGRCEVVMKLDFLCPRQYCDVGEMIKRSDEAMKKAEDFTLRIEGNKIFVNREPITPEEKQRFYAAICKVYYGICDNTARDAIVKEMRSLLKDGDNDEEQP